MSDVKWYFLDPDHNKQSPEGFHCARCKRKFTRVVNEGSYQGIIMHPIHPWFRLKDLLEREDGMIGADCLKYVIENFGEQ